VPPSVTSAQKVPFTSAENIVVKHEVTQNMLVAGYDFFQEEKDFEPINSHVTPCPCECHQGITMEKAEEGGPSTALLGSRCRGRVDENSGELSVA